MLIARDLRIIIYIYIFQIVYIKNCKIPTIIFRKKIFQQNSVYFHEPQILKLHISLYNDVNLLRNMPIKLFTKQPGSLYNHLHFWMNFIFNEPMQVQGITIMTFCFSSSLTFLAQYKISIYQSDWNNHFFRKINDLYSDISDPFDC